MASVEERCTDLEQHCCKMVCKAFTCYLRKNPWIALHAACLIAFIVQMCILANNQIYPKATVSHLEEMKLGEIEFPVLFKICIKPSFDMKELHEVGYTNIWSYFMGQSRHNKSLFGWGGHTEDGKTIGSVQGRSQM